VFFDAQIAIPSGCISFDADFNNTCSLSEESINDHMLMLQNLRYNLFLSTMFSFLIMTQITLNLMKELELFLNENRNGNVYMGNFNLIYLKFYFN